MLCGYVLTQYARMNVLCDDCVRRYACVKRVAGVCAYVSAGCGKANASRLSLFSHFCPPWVSIIRVRRDVITNTTCVSARYKTGDIIRVLVDMENLTLAFEKNGVYMGISHRNLPAAGVCPAFSLYNNYDRITVLECGMY